MITATDSPPIAVDVYCCQGGATRGYQLAGFRVVGVDLDPQPRRLTGTHPPKET